VELIDVQDDKVLWRDSSFEVTASESSLMVQQWARTIANAVRLKLVGK
jgi:hypothetical protein